MAPGPSTIATRHLRTLFALGAAGSLTDAELLDRFARSPGEAGEFAFALLVERHGPTVLRVARVHLRDEASALDAFQATFLILARKARSVRVDDSLAPWLREVARRVASQARRAESRRRFHERSAAGPEAGPPRDPGRSDLLRVISQEVERLPTAFRLAVVACHLDGLTQQEAAGRLGWKLGTLQSRLDRGRRRLREALRRRGLAPSLAPLALKLDAIPPALAASTARAAGVLHCGKAAGGVIAPAVLAMIETTTKGMVMMKLKLGALALVMIGGAVGSGVGLGVGRPVLATGDAGQVQAGEPARGDGLPPDVAHISVVTEQAIRGVGGKPKGIKPDEAGAIPPPADGPGFPYLIEFYETMSVFGLEHHQMVATLVRHGYPIKSVDVGPIGKDGVRVARAMTDRYGVYSYPTLVLVDGQGDQIARLVPAGSAPAHLATFYIDDQPTALKVAAFYNENRSKPAEKAPPSEGPAATRNSSATSSKLPEPEPAIVEDLPPARRQAPEAPSAEPSRLVAITPRPWETAVRVKLPVPGQPTGTGSGTIIHSDSRRTQILTSAHNFNRRQFLPAGEGINYQSEIVVNLTDDKVEGGVLGEARCLDKDWPARVVGVDFDQDLLLLQIHPGRVLPTSPIADGAPTWGANLFAVGCSNGGNATTWSITVIQPLVRLAKQFGTAEATIQCNFEPKPGRSGGGLFDAGGALVGICLYADPQDHTGFYARPESIHDFLVPFGIPMPIQRKHGAAPDNYDSPTVEKSPRAVPISGQVIPEPRPTGRRPATDRDPADAEKTPLLPEPGTARVRPPTDQDRRIDELERKLDRILKALESPKAVPPDDPANPARRQ